MTIIDGGECMFFALDVGSLLHNINIYVVPRNQYVNIIHF
jgi:hypothetical protein